MKRLLVVVLAGFLFTGCTQWKRLNGTDDQKEENAENIGGVWIGQINGQQFSLIIVQDKGTIKADSLMLGAIHGNVSGSVSGRSISMVGDESPACPNKWTFSGEGSGQSLILSIHGNGNNNGLTCYPTPINEAFVMGR